MDRTWEALWPTLPAYRNKETLVSLKKLLERHE